MPILEADRLQVRPFTLDDLVAIHQILDVELDKVDVHTSGAKALRERKRWLEWTLLGYEQFAQLYQPPYGDRAVVLKAAGQVIGAVGYAPCLDAFDQLPHFSATPTPGRPASTEFGLYYAISPAFQGQGYATEAARALIVYAFNQLRLKRVVATTTYDNVASIGVMRKLGMRVEKNPFPDPPWLQIVGLLENQQIQI
ncbi:MAG: GNAT family N-acetyltransferase [Chloroflexi bacterium]|nr:GNAT family N-acetyltransferase [Chloroflexota bacterium]